MSRRLNVLAAFCVSAAWMSACAFECSDFASIITGGYDFTGKTINLVDSADLVVSIAVDGDGNIVLEPKEKGIIISVC